MIEATTSARTRDAMIAAHEARGEALKALLGWLFKTEDAPLTPKSFQEGLTEPCR